MKTLTLVLAVLALAMNTQAKIVKKPVAYEQGGVALEGYLVYDDAASSTPRAGVVIVPEWWGLNDYIKGRAEQIAQLGYVALAIDMYGKGVTTTDPKKAGELAGQFYGKPLMAERARAGLDQLLATKLVDPARVAAIGYCFGGATVQALAFSGAPLAGIVSFHGGLIAPSAEMAARTKAKLLICQGAVDPFETKEEVDGFKKALDDGKLDYQMIFYSGAIHAFTNPGADELAQKSGLKGIGYNAAADRRSWAHMQVFFDEVLGAAR